MDSSELAAAQLPRTRFRDGYAIDEVDDVIAQCVDALRSWERGHPATLAPEAIVLKRFRTVRFADAYDADAVDDLLDQVVEQLRTYGPALTPAPSAARSGGSAPATGSTAAVMPALPDGRSPWLFIALRVGGVLAVVAVGIMIAMKLFGQG